MYTLVVENEKGQQLELTQSNQYDVVQVTGLNPPVAAINTVNVAGFDGSRFNSSRIEQRNIVITLNIKFPIEENRLRLYEYFKVKRYIKVYYKNEHRDVYVEGYVETFENDLFGMLQQPQISIICPDPFWKSVEPVTVDFSTKIALFEFPFSIPSEGIEFSRIQNIATTYLNIGDVETGAIITFRSTADQVLNPKFYNRTTSKFFGLDLQLDQGDVVVINTQRGHKSVTLTKRGQVTTNAISHRTVGSSWITFEPGENEISYSADEGESDLVVTVTSVQKYEGV